MQKHHFPQGLSALSSDSSSDAPSFYVFPSSLACGFPLPLRSAARSPCAQSMRTAGVDPVPPQPSPVPPHLEPNSFCPSAFWNLPSHRPLSTSLTLKHTVVHLPAALPPHALPAFCFHVASLPRFSVNIASLRLRPTPLVKLPLCAKPVPMSVMSQLLPLWCFQPSGAGAPAPLGPLLGGAAVAQRRVEIFP